MSRETRLLILTLTVSAVVLLLLSRLRFPERAPIAASPVAPLERLAARATYDELAGIVARVERQVAPSLVLLRLTSRTDSSPRGLADLLSAGVSGAFSHVAALRLNDTTALAALDGNVRIVDMLHRAPGDEGAAVTLLAADPVRRLALVRVPRAGSTPPRHVTLTDLETPTYVVVVEGTRAGLTFRPLFVGSSDRFSDPRWARPLLAVSSVALASPGALVFSLEGQFLGIAAIESGTLAIAGARDVLATAAELSAGTRKGPVDPGVSVQPLTAALAAALQVSSGAVVADVEADGPAAGVLQPIDVITSVDGQPIQSPDDFLLRVAQAAPRQILTLSIVRAGQPQTVALTLTEAAAPAAPAVATASGPGFSLELRRGVGSAITAIAASGAAQAAGLAPGDLIVRADARDAPTPAQIGQLVRSRDSQAPLVLTVERDGRRRVVALERRPPG